MTKKNSLFISLIGLTLFANYARAEYQFNLPPPATVVAREIYNLHNLILLVCLVIFIIVFGAMFYALYKHRKSVGHEAVQFDHNKKLEYVWTIIPFFILIGMAYPATTVILGMKDTSTPDMSIKITGHQWKWEYEYLDEKLSYLSNLSTTEDQIHNVVAKGQYYLLETDKPLVVPTGKKIRLLLTADDVIHAWWVPAFGVKQDAIPGFIKEAWIKVDEPGVYRGQCAELCGVGHAYMPIVVEAVTPEKYALWLQEQKKFIAATAEAATKTYALAELVALGEKVYTANCAMCHQTNGRGLPGVFPPLIGGVEFSGSPQMTGPLAERGFWKDGKILLGSKKQHLDVVMHGIPGTAMPAFGKQLSDLDIAAVVNYERNTWGNKSAETIQPAEVAALRK